MPKPACARKPARHFANSCILSQKSCQKHNIHRRRLSPSADRYVYHCCRRQRGDATDHHV